MKELVGAIVAVDVTLTGDRAVVLIAVNRETSLLAVSYDTEFLLNSFNEVRNFFPPKHCEETYASFDKCDLPYQSNLSSIKFTGRNAAIMTQCLLPIMAIVKQHPEKFQEFLDYPVHDDLLFGCMKGNLAVFTTNDPGVGLRFWVISSQDQFINQFETHVFDDRLGLKEQLLLQIAKFMPKTSDNELVVVKGPVAGLMTAAVMLQAAVDLLPNAVIIEDNRPPWAHNAQNN